MARKIEAKAAGEARYQSGTTALSGMTARSETTALKSDESAQVIGALKEVTDLLTSTTKQLHEFALSRAAAGPAGGPPSGPAQINTWDDPFSESTATTNPPIASPTVVTTTVNGFSKLRTAIAEPQVPPSRYNPGTAGFRYWVAAEALARGVNFWGALLPTGATWSTSNPMRVTLVDAGQVLNANYTRAFGLRFFRRIVRNIDIHSCESPDVVCHELGHAVLDALKPQLFNVANTETSAFHESFGDMSAILCALQLPSVRQGAIAETGGRLNVNSRLSRLAEQLGWGIRQLSPTAVDRDSLRNAANRFFYRRPDLLPPSAPSNLLSTEEHSFSRVFTGAFLDALARMFAATGAPNEANLLTVSRESGQLLVDAVHAAPVTAAYFSQVAAAMIQADQARYGGRHRSALTSAFLERGILSIGSTIAMASAPVPTAVPIAPEAMAAGDVGAGSPVVYSYDGAGEDNAFRLGFGKTPELQLRTVSLGGGVTIEVHAPEELPRFAVESAMVGTQSDGPLDVAAATRLFVDGLIQRREVDLGPATDIVADIGSKDVSRVTHSLVTKDGKTVLQRNHFNCGCRQDIADRPAITCIS